jgi:hydrogenase expression/formation protein HypE
MTNPSEPTGLGACPLPITRHSTIQLAHGSGGKLTHELVTRLFALRFANPALERLDDQAEIEVGGTRLAFTTDSYVVDPIFFPGGDIGELAVNGTINDLCMCGARPVALSAGFILEEGLPVADLERIVESMQRAARNAGVEIVTGDTKVVNRGKGDKLFINTSGIGILEHPYDISSRRLADGDRILISGSIANHGLAILSRREGLAFECPIESDTAALHELTAALVDGLGGALRAMRDPTRGGVAAVLNEFAAASRVGILLEQSAIPVRPAVAGACELLGLDPLYVANEGILIAVVAGGEADRALGIMRRLELGRQAAVIGKVRREPESLVALRTLLGTERIVDMPVGEQLPRIC